MGNEYFVRVPLSRIKVINDPYESNKFERIKKSQNKDSIEYAIKFFEDMYTKDPFLTLELNLDSGERKSDKAEDWRTATKPAWEAEDFIKIPLQRIRIINDTHSHAGLELEEIKKSANQETILRFINYIESMFVDGLLCISL